MEVIAIIISGLALALGAFNIYWTFFRTKKRFYLIGITNVHSIMMTPQFALTNGGEEDILITSLSCCFQGKDKNHLFYPEQKIEYNESDSLLLQAGKSFHCKVSFLQPFTSSFTLGGVESEGRYMHLMKVELEWVEPDGRGYKKSVELIKYGFDEAGGIKYRALVNKKYDLYS